MIQTSFSASANACARAQSSSMDGGRSVASASSPPPACGPTYSHNTALAAASSLPVILENGRKVFGPPPGFSGPRPANECELFIARVPEQLDEMDFLVWLHRCIGSVYELRLMMDSGHTTRGYAFIRFVCEQQALAAYELLSFHFVEGERLSVFRSQGKNRLYVSNIPKQMPLVALEAGFRKTFPELQTCTAYCEGPAQNRGYAFIEFYDHEQALEAKKRTTPGRVRMWGCDLKVQWAKPKMPHGRPTAPDEGMTLSRWCGNGAGGSMNRAPAQPRDQNDYCAKLRLFCLANNWCIPLVLYGSNFRQEGIQYCGILLKDATSGGFALVLAEVSVSRVYDVHVLLCELAVHLIERANGLPKLHHVLRVPDSTRAEIVHAFSDSLHALSIQLHRFDRILLHVESVVALGTSLQILAQYSDDALLAHYKNSFLTNPINGGAPPMAMPLLRLQENTPLAQFFAILPKFRNNPPLRNNFNDSEITLLQAAAFSGLPTSPPWDPPFQSCFNGPFFRLKSQRVQVQYNYVLQFVDAAQGRSFYHPNQRFNSHPIWIRAHTYQKSIFELN